MTLAIQAKTLQGWVHREPITERLRPVLRRIGREPIFERLGPLLRRVGGHPATPFAALLSGLLLVFFGTNFGWFLWTVRSATASTYVLQPILWLAIGTGAVYIHRTRSVPLMAGFSRVPATVLIGFFHLSVLIIVGLLSGFANSPYAHGIPNLALNTVFLGTSIIGMELARNLLVRSWGTGNTRLSVWVIGLLFGLMSLPLAQLTSLQGPDRTVHVLGTLVIPELAIHVFVTYIALRGGLLPAIAYRAILTGFEWYSPILPNATGFMSAFVAVSVAYVGYRTFISILGTEGESVQPAAVTEESLLKRLARYGWPAATILSVAVIWFSLGLFPYKPTGVLGQSMAPVHYRGDLLIMKSVEPDNLKVGDVIEYRVGSIAIVHRIIDLDRSPAGLLFFTKGDANDIADPAPVSPTQITGRYAFEIPKAGWPGIWVKKAIGFLAVGN